MDGAGFDSDRWDHWLLIVSFLAIATYGIWSTWQWNQSIRRANEKSRAKAKLARCLAIEIHPDQVRSPNSYPAASDPAVSKTSVVEASGRFRAQSRRR